jgi:hypothetical protein
VAAAAAAWVAVAAVVAAGPGDGLRGNARQLPNMASHWASDFGVNT